MPLPMLDQPDALRPSAAEVLRAWTARVTAERAQTDRCREVADPSDFYAPTAHRFRFDPDQPPDPVEVALCALARPGDSWLDVGAGGGRYALPLSRVVHRVIAVEPSDAMVATLRRGMAAAHAGNVDVVARRWPFDDGPEDRASTPRADVALMAHVGYDIEAIGPFLDAFESAARRCCVAVMGEGAMTTVGRRYWAPVHGERRVALPALPDLVTLLMARGRLPEVRLVDRPVPVFATFEELHDRARRQLWLHPGSGRDAILEAALRRDAVSQGDAWCLPDDRSRIGIVTWSPDDGPSPVDPTA